MGPSWEENNREAFVLLLFMAASFLASALTQSGHSLSWLPDAGRDPIVHYSQVPKPTAPGLASHLPPSNISYYFLRFSLENVGFILKLFKVDPLWTGISKRKKNQCPLAAKALEQANFWNKKKQAESDFKDLLWNNNLMLLCYYCSSKCS